MELIDITLQIISNSTNTQDSEITSDTWVNVALVVGTFLLVGITFWKIRESNNIAKESNKLVRTELKSKLRPLLQLSNFNVSRQEAKDGVLFRTILKNMGTIPARKIVMWQNRTHNEKIIHILKEKEKKKDNFPIGTIQNNGDYEIERFIDYKKDEQQELRYFMWFEYYKLDEKEESAILCRLNPNDWNKVKQEWFIQEDIDEARKELDDEKSGKKFAPTKKINDD